MAHSKASWKENTYTEAQKQKAKATLKTKWYHNTSYSKTYASPVQKNPHIV
jgi:hypothetical protein